MAVRIVDGGTYDTLEDALAAADAGDTLIADAGSYTGTYTINVEGLTIQGANAGDPGAGTVRDSASVVTTGFTINASNVTIDGFDFTGTVAGNEGSSIFLLGSNATIQNNVLVADTEEDLTGIVSGGGGGGHTFLGNSISGYAEYGIYVNATTDVSSVENNVFTENNEALVFEDGPSVDTVEGNSFEGSVFRDIRVSFRDAGADNLNAVTFRGNTFSAGGIDPITILGSGGSIVTGTSLDDTFIAAVLGSYENVGTGITFNGGAGADTFIGGAGNDTINGGSGADTAEFSSVRSDYTFVRTGDTVVVTDTRGNTGDGVDTLTNVETIRFSDVTINTSSIPDSDQGGGGGGTPPSTTPTAGPDMITGTPGQDNIISAGGGNDTVLAGSGNDQVFGNEDDDQLYGNQGSDIVYGGQGNDSVYGGQGEDITFGNKGEDVVYGNKDADQVFGNEDNDAVFGNEGDDYVHGGQGNDYVHGGQGNDSVFGGQGDDVLNGGLGDDFLEGGLGSDTFVFNSGQGNDIITDFSFEEGDRLDFQGQDYVLGQNNEGQAALFLEDGGTVVLLGLTPDEFQAGFVA